MKIWDENINGRYALVHVHPTHCNDMGEGVKVPCVDPYKDIIALSDDMCDIKAALADKVLSHNMHVVVAVLDLGEDLFVPAKFVFLRTRAEFDAAWTNNLNNVEWNVAYAIRINVEVK